MLLACKRGPQLFRGTWELEGLAFCHAGLRITKSDMIFDDVLAMQWLHMLRLLVEEIGYVAACWLATIDSGSIDLATL